MKCFAPVVVEDSKVGEFGIACEACHGPGERHVALQRKAKADGVELAPADDPIVNPVELTHQRSSEVCGRCHSIPYDRRLDLTKPDYRPGEELNKKRAEINKKYAFLAGVQGEALKKGERLKRIEEVQAEGAAKRQTAEAKLNNERQKGQIALREQNRLIDEAISKLEFQSQLAQQAGQREANQTSNRLRLKEAEYQVESQILQNSIYRAQAEGDYNKVYELRVQKARIDYQISVERIKMEVRLLEKTRNLARLKLEMLRVAVLETKEGSKQEKRLLRAVQLQKGVLSIAEDNLQAGRKIAAEQKKAAKEIEKGATPANASNTYSPSRTSIDTLCLSVASLGEK